MIPPCQEKWKHAVPAPKQNEHFRPHDVAGERHISLTYRCNRHHPIPTCDHGTPCIMHVEQRADFSTYVWECDWAKHQERCKFRTRWTDPIGSTTSSTSSTTITTSPAASAATAVADAVEGKGGKEKGEAADVAAAAGAGNGEQDGKEGKAGEIIVIDDDCIGNERQRESESAACVCAYCRLHVCTEWIECRCVCRFKPCVVKGQ